MEEHGANYYHYYSEIEEHFVRRREKNLLVSSLDWALIASWKELGIPLHVVLRGIDRSFEFYKARPRKGALVNTLFYCHQSVQECFAEYGDSQTGARREMAAESESSNPADDCSREERQQLWDLLARSLTAASMAAAAEGWTALAEDFQKAGKRLEASREEIEAQTVPNLSRLERDLQDIDRLLSEAILLAMGEETVAEWRKDAQKELRPYKKRVGREMYDKILANYLHRCARRRFALPPFTMHTL